MNPTSQTLSFANHEKPDDACDNLIGRAWRALNSLNPNLDVETTERCGKIAIKDINNYFKCLNIKYLVLGELINKDVDIPDCFSAKNLVSTFTQTQHHEFKLQTELGLLDSQEFFCDSSLFDLLPFQKSLLRFGKVLISCPFEGKAIASDQSFFVQAQGYMYNYILYRFVYNNNAYYLITGGVQGMKIGLFFPSKNLIIATSPYLQNSFAHSLSIFCARAIVNCFDFIEYLAYSQKKDSYLCLFYSKQFAHSIIADLSGFYASLYILLVKKDIQYIIGDNLLMNPSNIFHFIDSTKLLYENCDQAFVRSLRQKRLLIRPTCNNKISNNFESYIRSFSMSSSDSNVKEILRSLAGKQLIIHYVLRKKRTWNDTINGIIFIFLELRKIHPNSVLIIDGPTSFYNSEGDKIISDYSEIDLAKKIQESLPKDTCISIIGMSFPEKVRIVNEANFSISPYGAGSFLNLLLRTPCILLVSNVVFPGNFLKDWWLKFRPDISILPRLIIDSDPLLDSGNFSIDKQVVLNACLEMANELVGRRCND